jgi:hypothetical protein
VNIYIPSSGRADRLKTVERLTESLRHETLLVVPPAEVRGYIGKGVGVIECPHDGIVRTRDFIMEHAVKIARTDKFVMLDDDLIFQRRRSNDRITDCTGPETEMAFQWLERQLDEVAHAGFGARFLGYASTEVYTEPGRMMYVLGYNVAACREAGVSFGKGLNQFSTMEDFNMTLQLLTKGYPNRISLEWRCSPGMSNAPGGCSLWRTSVRQTESAKRLEGMFPGIVTVRPKEKWQGMEDLEDMFDVRVAWKKALKQYLETT